MNQILYVEARQEAESFGGFDWLSETNGFTLSWQLPHFVGNSHAGFWRLLLDPRAFVMVSTKLWGHCTPAFSVGLHIGRTWSRGRQMVPKKGVLNPESTSSPQPPSSPSDSSILSLSLSFEIFLLPKSGGQFFFKYRDISAITFSGT